MQDTLLFIDTEFTSFENPELISICLAKNNEDFIYLELPYNLNKCSDFVKDSALPLLSSTTTAVKEAVKQMAAYIQEHSQSHPVSIIGDTAQDWSLFLELMRPIGGKKELGLEGYINLYSRLGYIIHQDVTNDEIARTALGNIIIIYEAEQKSWFENHNKIEHHAKSDALANRYAFNQCVKYIKSISVKI